MPVIRLDASADLPDKVHDRVYEAISEALFQGRIAPLKSISLRSLASDLGVSPMPVRDAVRRLIAENALELQASNNRLRVPELSESRLEQLTAARVWVESQLSFRAVVNVSKPLVQRLKDDDARLMTALQTGDVAAYMQANQDFHFTIYKAAQADLLFGLARTLWLQVGPFMRVVFGRMGTVQLSHDYHQDVISAFERADADAVRVAMAADIREGMDLMLESIRAPADNPAKRLAK